MEEDQSRQGTASTKTPRGEMTGRHKERQRGQCGRHSEDRKAEGQVMGRRSQRQDGAGSPESLERGASAGLPTEEEMICFRF